MRRLSLAALPSAPSGKTGWPWTEETPALPEAMPDGRPWPRITVVTPSYNQADFLEETIRSVLLQAYPNLQYIVVDGGSRDGSVEIIERYSRWLDDWVSEPDRGQTHALNKGFARADGEIMAWLNSDDIYYPGALVTAARRMQRDGCDLFFGAMDKVEVLPDRVQFVRRSSPNQGEPMHRLPVLADGRRYDFHFFQPSMFWRRDLWDRAGSLDERYDYIMDIEWCNRALAAGPKVSTSDDVLTRFTLHPGSKSQEYAYRQRAEEALMYRRLAGAPGFRASACFAASLWPAQRAFSLRAAKASSERQPVKAGLLRIAARFVKLLSSLATRRYRRNAVRQGAAASGTRVSLP